MNLNRWSSPKKLIPIFLVGIFLASNCLLIFNILCLELNNETGFETQKDYPNLGLNNTIDFDLNSTSYTDEVHVNFTSINETKDFIMNGDFNSSFSGWDAQNETDINYEWTSNGPASAECLSTNLTGKDSYKKYRPMNESTGIENFNNLFGWYPINNDTSDFTHGWFGAKDHTGDLSGSLMHDYTGNQDTGGKANSSYQFYYDSRFDIISINLTFFYLWDVSDGIFSPNRLEIGVFLITPSQIYLINGWNKIFNDDPASSDFDNVTLSGFSDYFNETGFYNLTFYSIHSHINSNTPTTLWLDDIELNITWSLKEFLQNDTISWNQSIDFNRGVFSDGVLNYSYYITEKFEHINKSDIFLCTWINDKLVQSSPLTAIINNTWITNSTIVNMTLIGTGTIEVNLGLLFNATTYIFSNETCSLFFDNISLIIGSNPHPLQIELEAYDNGINKTFIVDRDLYNNDFVKITEASFEWGPSKTHYINITCNSSQVIVNLILTYFVFKVGGNGNGGNGDLPIINPSDIVALLFILIMLMAISSSLFVVRFQKRLFLNPKYDYIRKLQVKKRLRTKLDREAPVIPKKRCGACGKYINAGAKFCEHCGQPC